MRAGVKRAPFMSNWGSTQVKHLQPQRHIIERRKPVHPLLMQGHLQRRLLRRDLERLTVLRQASGEVQVDPDPQKYQKCQTCRDDVGQRDHVSGLLRAQVPDPILPTRGSAGEGLS
ncbi:hypothetical protein GCM10009574_074800 [Streptomyces asiaticus]|uniref:Uncharacterized protein n=2 Tax=Streptomyces rhizosphaericus TaxID=114699 RepID=A0ABN1S6N1_9ACTN